MSLTAHLSDLAEALCLELSFRLRFARALCKLRADEAERASQRPAGAGGGSGGGGEGAVSVLRLSGLEAVETVELMAADSLAEHTPLLAARALLPSAPAASIVSRPAAPVSSSSPFRLPFPLQSTRLLARDPS